MALLQTPQATGSKPVQTVHEHAITPLVYEYTTTATAVTTSDIIELGPLAPYGVVVDWILVSDDLDTNGSPAITMTMGVLNAGKTDVETAWVTSSNIGQASGVARMATAVPPRTAIEHDAPPVLGLKLPVAAGTWGGADKKITLTVLVRPLQ